jgi:hypothetical protein
MSKSEVKKDLGRVLRYQSYLKPDQQLLMRYRGSPQAWGATRVE